MLSELYGLVAVVSHCIDFVIAVITHKTLYIIDIVAARKINVCYGFGIAIVTP